MPTKDPHIATIDAHEAIQEIHAVLQRTIAMVRAKIAVGHKLTSEEMAELRHIRALAIENVKRIQEAYVKEIDSHTQQTKLESLN